MIDLIKNMDLNFYRRFEEMNLEELKQNAEALNTPATAFDILTIHKSISVLEEKLTKLSEELARSLEVTIKNGSDKRVKIGDLVLEIYEDHKNLRIRKSIASFCKNNKSLMFVLILIVSFFLGTIIGVKLDIDLIKFLLTL